MPRAYRRRLPHWRDEEAIYFVTICLHRSRPDFIPEERRIVLQVIRHFDRQRFHLHAAVVMNDHVHAILRPYPGYRLERIVQGWKAVTARLLAIAGRACPFWQVEYYDRLIRTQEELGWKVRYVVENPRRRWAGIEGYEFLWVESGWGFGNGEDGRDR